MIANAIRQNAWVSATATSKRCALSLGLSALLIFTSTPSAFAASDPINPTKPLAVELAAFEGHWQRIDDEPSDEARLSAIGHSLKNLSWIMRKMASPILRKTTKPPTRVEFAWDGEQLQQGVEAGYGIFRRPVNLNGEPLVAEDSRGVEFSSSWRWTESGLRLLWEQHQATGSNLYRIDPENQTLIVEHTIHVTAISNVQPILFQSRFSRMDGLDDPSESDSTSLPEVASEAPPD